MNTILSRVELRSKRMSAYRNFIKSLVVASCISSVSAPALKIATDKFVDKLILEPVGLDDANIERNIKELGNRLDLISERQKRIGNTQETLLRMLESFRSGRLIKDDKTIIEAQLKSYEVAKITKSISFWISFIGLWTSIFGLSLGILYRRNRFSSSEKDIDRLISTVKEQQIVLQEMTRLLSFIVQNPKDPKINEVRRSLENLEKQMIEAWGEPKDWVGRL